MTRYLIRRAVVGDAVALRRLNREFNRDETSLRWTKARLSDRVAADRVFVAVAAGEIIGFCCVTIVMTFCRESPRAEITELFVAGPHRRKGVARRLMMAAEECAQEANVLEFFVLTNKGNKAGRHLYQALGYVEGNDTLYRKLKKRSSPRRGRGER